jgi:hypothetical protein
LVPLERFLLRGQGGLRRFGLWLRFDWRLCSSGLGFRRRSWFWLRYRLGFGFARSYFLDRLGFRGLDHILNRFRLRYSFVVVFPREIVPYLLV